MQQARPDRVQAIKRLLNPRSIAVIGASADLNKVNGRPLKHLVEKGFQGDILPVNPKYAEIEDLTCYPSVDALPQPPDLAIVALAAREVCGCIAELGRKGTTAAVVFSSGFGEMGEAGKALEQDLARTAREAGVVLLGPNCLGFINAFDNVYATFSQYADGQTGPGPVAFVSQSGAFGTAVAALIRQRGLGLGYFINTGNQVDLDSSELMMAVIEDPRIKVAAGYLEGVKDGDGLVRLARKCRELGKPLVLTKVGRAGSGARAAASHTGALAVEDHVFDAVIRQFGVLRARNEQQMLDMLEVLCQPRRPAGNGLGIATQSGGAGVMMADRADECGLVIPELSPQTRTRMAEVMPAFGTISNPADVTGQFVAHPELLRETVIALLDDPNIDVGVVWLQLMTRHVETLVDIFSDILARSSKPFFVCWVAAPANAVQMLRKRGGVVFTSGEAAVEAVAALVRYAAWQRRKAEPTVQARTSAPDAGPGGYTNGLQDTVSASARLREAGIPMAQAALATTEDEAVSIWSGYGVPVALKIESPDILHKTEIGGVLLNVNGEAALREGFRTLMARARDHHPQALLAGVLVQKMSGGGTELVIGVKRDPVLGMIVMVGIGGIFVEVLKDVAFRRAPFDLTEARAMLGELKAGALLDGVRGKPAVDRDAIAALLVRVSQWASDMQSVLSELDLNPVIVGPSAIEAVDCVMIFEKEETQVSGRS